MKIEDKLEGAKNNGSLDLWQLARIIPGELLQTQYVSIKEIYLDLNIYISQLYFLKDIFCSYIYCLSWQIVLHPISGSKKTADSAPGGTYTVI